MTEEEEARITSAMRVLKVLNKYSEQVNQVPELAAEVEKVKEILRQLFEELTEDEHNLLLERFQEELKWMEENQ